MLGPVGTPVPIRCALRDLDGRLLEADPIVRSASGRVSGDTCATLAIERSGHDVLELSAEGFTATVALVLAATPSLREPWGEPVVADQLPDLVYWAPSATVNEDGETELYAGAFPADTDGAALPGGDLVRFTGDGTSSFRFEGRVLTHDPVGCSLLGTGIENVAIVRRAEAPGWRMFFAGGSSTCYGWQVFSATSLDRKRWTIEPGVRITNGGTVPPAASVDPPWQVGEGMVVDQLESGVWRMFVGGKIPGVTTAADGFSIVEWRSPDQLVWRFERPVITQEALGLTRARSLYSPAVVEVAPGLRRMIFAENGGDLLDETFLHTAVSADGGERWTYEGVLAADPRSRVYYAAVAGDQLFFVKRPLGAPQRAQYLARAALRMP